MPYFLPAHYNKTFSDEESVFYYDVGQGDILFMIHSWYQNGMECYGNYIDHFSERYRVVVPDLPGHGRSSKARSLEYSVEHTTRILKELLKMLRKEKVQIHLIGASVGSFIGMKIALESPELVDNLILISPMLSFKASTNSIRKLLKLPGFMLKLDLLYRAYIDKFPFNARKSRYWNINGEIPGKLAHYKQKMLNHPIHCARSFLNSFLPHSLEDIYHTNTKPTLFIYGGKDQLTPEDFAHSLARKLPRAVLRVVEDGGHYLFVKKDRDVIKLIGEFLEQHRKRPFRWLSVFWKR